MARIKKEKVVLYYDRIGMTAETQHKLKMILTMGRRYSKGYTKQALLKDAIDNLWELFMELEEASESGQPIYIEHIN